MNSNQDNKRNEDRFTYTSTDGLSVVKSSLEMKMANRIEEIFVPMMKQFCVATKPLEMNGNFSTLFLPHVMKNYDQAERKIFYFGRDTYGWAQTSELFQAYSNNVLLNYFKETSKWAREFKFLDYNKNKPSGFWTLVIRLHLRLKGFEENLSIGNNLPEEYYKYINDFGWGNTNAIEVPPSLKNRKVWKTLDKIKYRKVKEESYHFDKLIHIIKAYKPDLVFIFNWDRDKKSFLEGLKYSEQKLNLVNNHFLSYYLPDTGTRVIWTMHPTAARWQGYGVDSLIDELIHYLKSIGEL